MMFSLVSDLPYQTPVLSIPRFPLCSWSSSKRQFPFPKPPVLALIPQIKSSLVYTHATFSVLLLTIVFRFAIVQRFVVFRVPEQLVEEVAFSPYDTVDRCTGCRSDGAHWISGGCWFGSAVEAFSHALFDNIRLTQVACGARLDQRDICCQAHTIHMPPRI
jgi:hypothetical protein